MAIAEFTKVLAAYVFPEQTSRRDVGLGKGVPSLIAVKHNQETQPKFKLFFS
jgi:hypothetical protein